MKMSGGNYIFYGHETGEFPVVAILASDLPVPRRHSTDQKFRSKAGSSRESVPSSKTSGSATGVFTPGLSFPKLCRKSLSTRQTGGAYTELNMGTIRGPPTQPERPLQT